MSVVDDVHEIPLLSKQHILAAVAPLGAASSDAPLRTLKRHSAMSSGLDVTLRSAHAGQLIGRLQVFCSLNRDAARLSRSRQWEAAARLARAAGRIEASSDVKQLKKVLENLTLDVSGVAPWQAYVQAVQVPTARDLVVRIAKSAERARRQAGVLDAGNATITGIISGLEGGFVDVQSDQGAQVRVPRVALAEADWDHIGFAVVIHVEQNHQFTLWEVAPALSSVATEAEQMQVNPFDHEWPASPALTGRVQDLLRGPGTIPLTLSDLAAAS